MTLTKKYILVFCAMVGFVLVSVVGNFYLAGYMYGDLGQDPKTYYVECSNPDISFVASNVQYGDGWLSCNIGTGEDKTKIVITTPMCVVTSTGAVDKILQKYSRDPKPASRQIPYGL